MNFLTDKTNNKASNENMALIRKPPLVRLESEYFDDDDDSTSTNKNGTNNQPYPGIDDGLLLPPSTINPDVEILPKEPEEIPEFHSRAGPTDDNDDPDVETIPPKKPSSSQPPNDDRDKQPGDVDGVDGKLPPRRYPFDYPGVFDVELGSNPDLNIPDVNIYQQKKTLAQGMMDLALFSANANQLRYVLESYERHPYFYPSIVLISISLLFQVGVGVGLIWNATYNVKDEKEICIANRINNLTVIGIFLITVINVFISAFGVANPR